LKGWLEMALIVKVSACSASKMMKERKLREQEKVFLLLKKVKVYDFRTTNFSVVIFA
jgi:hypothetical protein